MDRLIYANAFAEWIHKNVPADTPDALITKSFVMAALSSESITPTVQKAVKPKEVKMYPRDQYACGACGHVSVGSKDYHAKYCPECGRAVKW